MISEELKISDIGRFVPKNTTLLMLGTTSKLTILAKQFAAAHDMSSLFFTPDFERHGENANFERDKLMIQIADSVVVLWDGNDIETKLATDYAKSVGKRVKLHLIDVTGIELFPGNSGKDCPGNGKHNSTKCCCDECDFYMCCNGEKPINCAECPEEFCPAYKG